MSSAEPSGDIHPQRRRFSRRLAFALVLVAAGASVGYWFWTTQQSYAAETRAVEALRKLDALLVMDAANQHVASVNLSTMPSADSLDKAIEQLDGLHRLTSLDASRTAITDQHLQAIGQLSSLTSLSLNETAVSDEGVAHLRGLSNLEALHLASTQITGQALAALGALKHLRVLDLSATKVAGGLEPLTTLPQLEWLVLRNLMLDDEALTPLASSQSLTRLSLEDSKYAKEEALALKRSLKNLSLDE